MTISEEDLFKDPPPKEDCPICFLPIPHSHASLGVPVTYQACCGQTLCFGCVLAAQEEMDEGNMKRCCPFCREPLPSSHKVVKRLKKRTKANDGKAFYALGRYYARGDSGLQQNFKLAIDLYTRASELGTTDGHYALWQAYYFGEGIDKDMQKAVYYAKLAAMGGSEAARYMLGGEEIELDNEEKAMKHFMIAAKSGHEKALKMIGEAYKYGDVTKDEYAMALRSYQTSRDEMKSAQRTRAEKEFGRQQP